MLDNMKRGLQQVCIENKYSCTIIYFYRVAELPEKRET